MPRVIRWKRRPIRSFSTAPTITGISVSRARLGATVSFTLTGSNFRSCPNGTLPTVKFGALSATNIVVVDQFTITGTTPIATASGIVDITVTVGCCE